MDDKPKVGEERERVVEAARLRPFEDSLYAISESLAWRIVRMHLQSHNLKEITEDIASSIRLLHTTYSAELQRRLDEYTENRKVADCVDCGGSIWFREARIQDESGTYHPMCRITKRAEAAEAKAEQLQKAMELAIDIVCYADGALDDSMYIDKFRTKYDLPTLVEKWQALSGEPPSPDSESTTTNEGKGETTNE
jgi:hypothetical protein